MRHMGNFAMLTSWVFASCNVPTEATPVMEKSDIKDRADCRDTKPFVHPGALHTVQDIHRVKDRLTKQEEPWVTAFDHLEASKLAQTTWKPTPQTVLVRGVNEKLAENYGYAYRDAHSAYQLTLRWLISGNSSYATAVVTILNGWSSTLTDIYGNSDMYLAAGLYGYQFANAAELLRSYSGWSKGDQKHLALCSTTFLHTIILFFLTRTTTSPTLITPIGIFATLPP